MDERVSTFAGEGASCTACGKRVPVTLISSSVYTRERALVARVESSAASSENAFANPAKGIKKTSKSDRTRQVLHDGKRDNGLCTKKPLFSWEDRGSLGAREGKTSLRRPPPSREGVVWTRYRQVSWLVTDFVFCLPNPWVSGRYTRCHLQLRGSFRLNGIPYTGIVSVKELIKYTCDGAECQAYSPDVEY